MTQTSSDNIALPYKIEGLDVQGRVVRLGGEIDTILSRHDYPEPVARLLAQAMVLTVMLGSSLKFEGRFVVQTQSDGPVPMLICDMQTSGQIRAYAKIDRDKLAMYGKNPSQQVLMGKGHIAFTVDQGADMENYQGVVPLEGSLTDAAHVYFEQSEQIETRLKLAAEKPKRPRGQLFGVPAGYCCSRLRRKVAGAMICQASQRPAQAFAPRMTGGD